MVEVNPKLENRENVKSALMCKCFVSQWKKLKFHVIYSFITVLQDYKKRQKKYMRTYSN